MSRSPAGKSLIRALVAVAPLGLSLAFAWALTGPLSLGAGEKDLFLAMPPILWSLLFLLISLGLWWRNLRLRPTVVWAAGSSTAVVVAALLGLIVLAQAGHGA